MRTGGRRGWGRQQSRSEVFQRLWYQMDELNKVSYVGSLEEGTIAVETQPKRVLLGPPLSLLLERTL